MTFTTEGYTFVETIGRGGFGTSSVYRRDRDGELHIIKTIPREDTRRYTVEREYRLMRRAWKDGCTRMPKAVGLWEDEKNFGIIMEYLEGYVSLEQWCESYTVNSKRLTHLARVLMEAFDCLHDHGIYHRDIHTGNIMVMPDDNGTIQDLRVIDFGVACYRSSCFSESAFNLYYSHPDWIKYSTAQTKVAEDPDRFKKYDEWGIGMILVALANGGIHPFHPDMKDVGVAGILLFWFSPLVRQSAKAHHHKWSRLVRSITGKDLLSFTFGESSP